MQRNRRTGANQANFGGLLRADLSSKAKLRVALTGLFDQVRAGPAAEALLPWIRDVLPSLHSRRAYFNDLQAFFVRMKEQGVHPFQVTGDHVRIYKEVIQRSGRRPATIARALSVIRGTYEQFGKKGLVPWNVVGDIHAVTSPRVEKNSTPGLSEAEAKKLLHAPDETTLTGAVYIFCDEVDVYFAEITAKGAVTDGPPQTYPYDLRDFIARDLDGNHLSFGAPVK